MSQHWYNKAGELVDPWEKGALPSPSTILDRIKADGYDALVRRLGLEAADELMDNAAARGTRVHKACELWVNDIANDVPASREVAIADAELLPNEVPYLDGFINWWDMMHTTGHTVQLVNSEAVVFSHKYKYAGRVDLIVKIDNDVWIIDIKTGQDNVRHGLQLRFYAQAFYEMTGIRARMGVLGLDPKRACGYRNSRSPYGLQEYKEPLAAIVAHIKVFKWWNKKHPAKKPVETITWSPEDVEVTA